MMGAFMGGFIGAMVGCILIFLLCAIAINKNDDDWRNKR